ncbi:hypothetical protein GCM10023144_34190 [Pigmentiphaga soli]|uniref:Transmembrane protein n=1 Tax=Pigmentiphaga soli TaxID=1007095 RepID=A0ABP8HDJ5_9BURK
MHVTLLVAIGWLYVTVLMSLAQDSVLAGIGTLLFYGLLPLAIVLYLMLAPARRRRRLALEAEALARERAARAAPPEAR